MRRPGRYARRLLVVAMVIAALVGLGYLWRSSPLASIVSDGGGRDGRPSRDGQFRDRGSGPAFSLGNIDDLLGTVVIGVGVMGAVVVIDKIRRRRRPIGAARVPSAPSDAA